MSQGEDLGGTSPRKIFAIYKKSTIFNKMFRAKMRRPYITDRNLSIIFAFKNIALMENIARVQFALI